MERAQTIIAPAITFVRIATNSFQQNRQALISNFSNEENNMRFILFNLHLNLTLRALLCTFVED